MSEQRSAVLLEDPDLARQLGDARRAAAERDGVARVAHVPAGTWEPEQLAASVRLGIGLLVLDGLLASHIAGSVCG